LLTVSSSSLSASPRHPAHYSLPTRRSSDLGSPRRLPRRHPLEAPVLRPEERCDADILEGVGRRREVFRHLPPRLRLSQPGDRGGDRKSTRLNSSHGSISYAVFCLKSKI